MAISIKPLGAGQEVGRSCVIVRIKDVKIMFDCGVHMAYHDNRKFPDFKKILEMEKENENSMEKNLKNLNNNLSSNIYSQDNISNPNNPNNPNQNIYQVLDSSIDFSKHVDLVIITHFHLDHCGALPYFTEICGYRGPIITSQPTRAILPLTLEDFRKIISEYRGEKSILRPDQILSCMEKIQTIEIGEEKIITGINNSKIKVTAYYAGHVLGAGIYKVEVDGYSVVYTGDYNTASDRHLSGAYVPRIYPDILITETTYGDTIRDTKRVREREFLKKIQTTIDNGGKVLIPIFALGRAQELCILLDTHWRRTKSEVPIYFAGPMAEKANFYYKLFTNWTNSKIKNIFLDRNVFDFTFVKHGDKSVTKSNQPMVIFATPGMLHGGLSLSIFKEIAPDSKNCVIIPGYCTAGTVGNKILSGERVVEIDKQSIEVKCDVYYMSFSAHADAKGLLQLIKNASPKNVVLVHGDVEVMKKFQKSVHASLSINTEMPANFQEIYFNGHIFYTPVSMSVLLFQKLSVLMERFGGLAKLEKEKISLLPYIKANNIGTSLVFKYFNPLKTRIQKIKNKISIPLSTGNNQNKSLSLENNIQELFTQFLNNFYPKILYFLQILLTDNILNIKYSNKKDKLDIEWSYLNSNLEEKRTHLKCITIAKYLDCFVRSINFNFNA